MIYLGLLGKKGNLGDVVKGATGVSSNDKNSLGINDSTNDKTKQLPSNGFTGDVKSVAGNNGS